MDNFTPEQIEQFLEQFFDVVGRRQYIGARYVPIFGRKDESTIEWDNTKPYEPLTIVLYQGNSYTSRTYVPAGIEITNEIYWANTGNYTAQIEQYRAEVQQALNTFDDLGAIIPRDQFTETDTVKKYIDDLGDIIPSDQFTDTDTVKKYIDDNIDDLGDIIPSDQFTSADTVKKYIDDNITDVNQDISAINELLPDSDFDSTNTVKKYIDDKTELNIKKFSTVAEMAQSANIADGDVCRTNGFHEIGDNGAGWYVINSTDTANGKNVIQCNGLVATLIVSSQLFPEQVGAYGDGIHDDTASCQVAVDLCKHVTFTNTYLVSKTIEPDNDDSCIMLNDNQIVDGNGTIHVNIHGQSVFGIRGKRNVSISDVRISGYGQFPILDGTTGRGEKGNTTGGYDTVGFWYYKFNNSYDTSQFTRHSSYGDDTVWGMFGNGFIGNIGAGILVEGTSENIYINNVESSGFNGAGIVVGHYGDNYTRRNISVTNCYLHNNYSAGIDMYRYENLTIEGCVIENIGHPNASITDTYQDPGYGVACSISDTAKKTKIINNTIKDCVRKGIDAHGVDTIIISNNDISKCWCVGIDLEGNGNTSFVRKAIISSNRMAECSYASNRLGAIFIGNTTNTTPITNGCIIFDSNEIVDCGLLGDSNGLFSIWIVNRLIFSNNIIHGYHASVSEVSSGRAAIIGTSRGAGGELIFVNNIFDFSQYPNVTSGIGFSNIDMLLLATNILKYNENNTPFVAATSVGTAPAHVESFGNLSNFILPSWAHSELTLPTGSSLTSMPNGSLMSSGDNVYYKNASGTVVKKFTLENV